MRTGFDLIRAAVPELRHRLVGTGAACLQGVELPMGDIDILVDRRRDRVRLELRLTTKFLRDCPDRHKPLLAHLGAHGADLELLHQSMTVRGIPATLARLTRGLRATS